LNSPPLTDITCRPVAPIVSAPSVGQSAIPRNIVFYRREISALVEGRLVDSEKRKVPSLFSQFSRIAARWYLAPVGIAQAFANACSQTQPTLRGLLTTTQLCCATALGRGYSALGVRNSSLRSARRSDGKALPVTSHPQRQHNAERERSSVAVRQLTRPQSRAKSGSVRLMRPNCRLVTQADDPN